MDVNDFEFRPLTKGLGFDKSTQDGEGATPRSQALRAAPTPQSSVRSIEKTEFSLPKKDFAATEERPVSRSLKKMLDSLPPSVDFQEDKQRELKLTRSQAPPQTPLSPPQFEPPKMPAQKENFDITLNNSLSQAFPKEEVSKRFYHQLVTPVPQFKEISTSFASAAIDALIALGLASLFVVTLVAITQVDLIRMLSTQGVGARVLLELGGLYIGIVLFYFMLARGLFGCTLGDWAFDVQLGSEEERRHLGYPLQVIFRTFMILVTGVILIPILSVIFSKDLAYYFSGLKLYRRQY